MSELRFAQPLCLWALAVLPFLAALLFHAERLRSDALNRLISFERPDPDQRMLDLPADDAGEGVAEEGGVAVETAVDVADRDEVSDDPFDDDEDFGLGR